MKAFLTHGRALWAVILTSGASGIARAAEKHTAHAEPSVASLFLPVVNFAIFVFVFHRYAWPALRGALTDRRMLVEREISEADHAHQEAKSALAEVEARRSRLREHGERLVREMRAEAERDRAALLESARKSAERIRSDARLLSEQEGARAAQAIREEIAGQVIARVVASLHERLTDEDEGRFVAEFVSAVETGGTP